MGLVSSFSGLVSSSTLGGVSTFSTLGAFLTGSGGLVVSLGWGMIFLGFSSPLLSTGGGVVPVVSLGAGRGLMGGNFLLTGLGDSFSFSGAFETAKPFKA
jgi:hypothetical protein